MRHYLKNYNKIETKNIAVLAHDKIEAKHVAEDEDHEWLYEDEEDSEKV